MPVPDQLPCLTTLTMIFSCHVVAMCQLQLLMTTTMTSSSMRRKATCTSSRG